MQLIALHAACWRHALEGGEIKVGLRAMTKPSASPSRSHARWLGFAYALSALAMVLCSSLPLAWALSWEADGQSSGMEGFAVILFYAPSIAFAALALCAWLYVKKLRGQPRSIKVAMGAMWLVTAAGAVWWLAPG